MRFSTKTAAWRVARIWSSFAQEHNLKIGTIADLIHYRVSNEKTVERVGECILPTEYGDFRLIAYQDSIDNELHLALVLGEVDEETPTLVRVHMQNTLCDLFSTSHKGCSSWPLESAIKRIAEEGEGIIVLLRNHDTSREILQRMHDFQVHGKEDPHSQRETPAHLRTFGIGAQIIADLGVRKMRVLSSPMSMHGISGFDLEVVEYVKCT